MGWTRVIATTGCLGPTDRFPLSIQPVVVLRGLNRQQVAALTNFVGCFFSCSVLLLFSLLRRWMTLLVPALGLWPEKHIPFHSIFQLIVPFCLSWLDQLPLAWLVSLISYLFNQTKMCWQSRLRLSPLPALRTQHTFSLMLPQLSRLSDFAQHVQLV